MEKLGNTPYEWENLEIQMDDSVSVPMKLLNQLRRQALAALEEEILQKYRRQEPASVSLLLRQQRNLYGKTFQSMFPVKTLRQLLRYIKERGSEECTFRSLL